MFLYVVYLVFGLKVLQTVALGYSKFCEIFTEEEWEGFNYAYEYCHVCISCSN